MTWFKRHKGEPKKKPVTVWRQSQAWQRKFDNWQDVISPKKNYDNVTE